MKKVTKVGLSALAGALAVTSASAGEMSISGSMEATYTKGSKYHTTGNPLGMDKELSITGSTELDNGMTVSYKQTTTDALAFSDSEMVLGTDFGTIALTSTGSPISAIDDVTPTAYEEANALVGSIDDVNGMDGDYGIRYTLADVMGSGFTFDAMYTPKHGSGDSTADNSNSGDGAGDEALEYVIKGSVPFVSGLSIGAGYVDLEKDEGAAVTDSEDIGQQEGTAYITYAYGPVTLGYQIGALSNAEADANDYVHRYYGISYKVSDNLSVSYNEIESKEVEESDNDDSGVEQEFDSISLSYTMGNMTLGIAHAGCDNCSYNTAVETDETSISMAVAF